MPGRASTSKQTLHVSVREDLVAAARDAGLDLSDTLERALIQVLADARRDTWRQENEAAISAYNERVLESGTFSDGSRSF